MTTLAEKVYIASEWAVEFGVDAPTPPENRAAVTLDDCRDLTEYEMDLRDWGVYYGIAFAIARSEDPFEDTEAVGYRAFKAAEEAWHRSHVPDRSIPIGQPPVRFRKAGAT